MSKKYVYVRVEEAAWDTIMETLSIDAESSAFDQPLREEIQDAIEATTVLGITDKVIKPSAFHSAFELK
jgi:hypothetical protein